MPRIILKTRVRRRNGNEEGTSVVSKMRKYFIFFLFFNVSIFINAQDTDKPSGNPEVVTYFYTEALSLLNFMDKTGSSELNEGVNEIPRFNFIPFFFSANGSIGGLSGDYANLGMQYNGLIGSVIRFSKYLSMPLFLSATGGQAAYETSYIGEHGYNEQKEFTYNSIYTGGGLVLSTKWGTLGGFVGYYGLYANDTFFDEMGDRHVRYGLIPVLNTTKYPLLKEVLRAIENYLSFDFHEDKLDLPGRSTKIISRPIRINDFFTISDIYVYNTDEYLNMVLRNRIWGGGISVGIIDMIDFGFEIANKDVYQAIPGLLTQVNGSNAFLDNKYWELKFSLGVQHYNKILWFNDPQILSIDLILPFRASDNAVDRFFNVSLFVSARSYKSYFGGSAINVQNVSVAARHRFQESW